MRKAIRDNGRILVPLTVEVLDRLYEKGWRFVQVKGITADLHYEHIEPHHFILIPIKQLPKEQADKDVYEPIDSDLLRLWAGQPDETVGVFVAADVSPDK